MGLTGMYEVVTEPALDRAFGDEVYSDSGDLDFDGTSNAVEYNNTIASGGGVDDFAGAVIDPASKGILMSLLGTWYLLAALALSLVIAALAAAFDWPWKANRRR